MPFRTLLYRYFFAGWLFQDGQPTGRGPLPELEARARLAQQASWLPVYVLRWFTCGSAVLLLGTMAERLGATSGAAWALQAAGLAAIGYAISIASTWARLRRRPA